MCIEQGIDWSWRKTVHISCAQASKVLIVWFSKFGIGALFFEIGMCLGLRLGSGLESGLSIGDGGNLCAMVALSSLATDRYSIKVIMV